jgi:DNA-binding GntR family transcriptional regulator
MQSNDGRLVTSGSDEMTPSVAVASSVSLSIYEHLRNEILAGEIPAGTRLRQAELARRYGVSITPVREALSALTSDGFTDSNPFTGSVVHQPTLKELDDIYKLRAWLMPMLVEASVANITSEQLARAEGLAENMSNLTFSGAWPKANSDFHYVLDSACDNAQLLGTMSRLAELSRGYVALSVASSAVRQGQANDEHFELFHLYRARNVTAATEVALRHIRETHRLVREVFEQQERHTRVFSTTGDEGRVGGR